MEKKLFNERKSRKMNFHFCPANAEEIKLGYMNEFLRRQTVFKVFIL